MTMANEHRGRTAAVLAIALVAVLATAFGSSANAARHPRSSRNRLSLS
jgi:hypothetical protein